MLTRKIGLIAGNGNLPRMIIDKCIKDNVPIYPIFIAGEEQQDSTEYLNLKIGEVGKAISYFQENQVTDIVFAGGIKRPNLSNIKVDLVGAKLLTKLLSAKFLGDDVLLRTVANFFEKYGFKVISPQEIITQNLTAPEGILAPGSNEINYNDINLGLNVARALGNLDIGQAVIVEMGYVIGVEAVEGTENLIKRCASLLKGQKQGILVKASKPNQDNRLDMPTIGVETIEQAYNNGLVGIAIEAEGVLILEHEKVVEKAKELGIFLIAVK